MGQAPLLTVAIPTCNGARHIAEALRGVLAQRGPAFELLISDDRSEDETLAIVGDETGDRVRIVVNAERLGLAGNWNRCLALSRGPLVSIFHQDDLMRPGHLDAHTTAFAADPEVGLVASATELVDNRGNPVAGRAVERGGLGPVDRTFPPGALLPHLAVGNPLRCSAVTIHKSAVADAGEFDPSYRYALDWDFWLRVARRRPVAWLARPTVAVRWHSASETHRFKSGTTDLEEQARLLDDLYARDGSTWPNARTLRRDAGRRLARAYLNRAHDALRHGDPHLARRCLRRSIAMSPLILATIGSDPRLAFLMGALAVAPAAAGRAFARRPGS